MPWFGVQVRENMNYLILNGRLKYSFSCSYKQQDTWGQMNAQLALPRPYIMWCITWHGASMCLMQVQVAIHCAAWKSPSLPMPNFISQSADVWTRQRRYCYLSESYFHVFYGTPRSSSTHFNVFLACIKQNMHCKPVWSRQANSSVSVMYWDLLTCQNTSISALDDGEKINAFYMCENTLITDNHRINILNDS